MSQPQIETLTVLGAVTLSGNAAVVVTGAYLTGSPITVSVAVLLGDDASAVAQQVRIALALTASITAQYAISGAGPNVILTDHTNRANDTSLVVTCDNDTCAGLTLATSTDTQAGDGVDNGYTTLADYKTYQRITSTDLTDDTYIEDAINAASRWIDNEARTTFYSATETRLLDVPTDPRDILLLDAHLLSITTLTNGSGGVVASTDYVLIPNNGLPKWGIRIKSSSGLYWRTTNGDPEQSISILGAWGYSASAPADIVSACREIAKALYSRRFGENMTTRTVITSAGVVQIPEGVPDMAAETIGKYRRLGFG